MLNKACCFVTLAQVGEKVPDFTLPNAKGNKVVLSTLLEEGPVVLHYFRG